VGQKTKPLTSCIGGRAKTADTRGILGVRMEKSLVPQRLKPNWFGDCTGTAEAGALTKHEA